VLECDDHVDESGDISGLVRTTDPSFMGMLIDSGNGEFESNNLLHNFQKL